MASALRIYVDGRPVYLQTGRPKDADAAWTRSHPAIYCRRAGDVKRALWLMEHNHLFDSLTIYGRDLREVRRRFAAMFRVIEAAGGLVVDARGKVLMIFRRGCWDLPKGKLDPGEKPSRAALREVEEETGVKSLKLGTKLLQTYHVYTDRPAGHVLKKTHWYRMRCPGKSRLVPETAEGITKARWVGRKKLPGRLARTYPNILDVFCEAGYGDLIPNPGRSAPGSRKATRTTTKT